jgi:hypothetical protein
MSEDTVRDVVAAFRSQACGPVGRAGPADPGAYFPSVRVLTWYREPDFSPEYRRLRDLELALSDRPITEDLELLSVWRLARDRGYAAWAREARGARVCQITFFGVAAANDWFFRRRGAFEDNLAATEGLLAAGILPRWQLFLTKRMVADLGAWSHLVTKMRLRERCKAVGGEFVIFVHLPAPEGEAFGIEHLRPTARDIAEVPRWLVEESKRHFGGRRPFGEPEAVLVRKVLGGELNPPPYEPEQLCFHVTADLDVYSNYGELTPWWRLGNLRRHSVGTMLRTFEEDAVPGLWASHHVPLEELAGRFGRPRGRRYYDPGDLRARWVGLWCRGVAERPAL